MRFEWDEAKNASNLRKHGIDFLVAQEVFDDPLASMRQDRFVDGEERWLALGMVFGRLMAVAFTHKESLNDEVIRIISARVADRTERRYFERGARTKDR